MKAYLMESIDLALHLLVGGLVIFGYAVIGAAIVWYVAELATAKKNTGSEGARGVTPDTITPNALRAAARGGNMTWLPALASCGPMLADAIEIADSCSRADIECNVPQVNGSIEEGIPRAYDLSRISYDDETMIQQSVRYLTARGLIERKGDIVRFKR